MAEELRSRPSRLPKMVSFQCQVARASRLAASNGNLRSGIEESFLESEGDLREYLSINHPQTPSAASTGEEDENVDFAFKSSFL